MKQKLPKLIVILGPTATGKTKLAVKLACEFNGEIVSADSRQVYQEMNIGTGKDLDDYRFKIYDLRFKKKVIKKIPYDLIDIIKPTTPFNLAKYKKLALKTIAGIHSRGKIPFLVGGTGLYISAIVHNYDIPKIKPNEKIRKTLKPLKPLNKINLLKKLDPKALDFVDVKNPRRLDRALEVCLSGYKFSDLRKKEKPLFNTLILGIALPKNKLNQRIDARVDKMIKNGLIDETKKLIKKYPPSSRLRRAGGQYAAPLQTIGYKEIIDYLNKKITLQKAVELIKTHTHQFAKRQMTWFKRNKKIKWIKDYPESKKIIKNFLKNSKGNFRDINHKF